MISIFTDKVIDLSVLQNISQNHDDVLLFCYPEQVSLLSKTYKNVFVFHTPIQSMQAFIQNGIRKCKIHTLYILFTNTGGNDWHKIIPLLFPFPRIIVLEHGSMFSAMNMFIWLKYIKWRVGQYVGVPKSSILAYFVMLPYVYLRILVTFIRNVFTIK